MGRIKQAQLQADAKDEVAKDLRDRFWIASGLLAKQAMFQLVGDFESARTAGDACLAEGHHLGSLVLRTLLEHEVGDFAEGERYMERLLEQATPEAIYLASDVGCLSVISLVGRITGTEAHFDVCQSAANTVLSSMSATRVERVLASLSLALMAAQVADIGVIEEHWGTLESSRGKMLGAGNTILANSDRILGLLAHVMGNLDDAQMYLNDALEFCRNAGYRPELAWCCYDYASLRKVQGDREGALACKPSAKVGLR
jgi:ATP/maltotriose-dependent transcriptional regulator MalT